MDGNSKQNHLVEFWKISLKIWWLLTSLGIGPNLFFTLIIILKSLVSLPYFHHHLINHIKFLDFHFSVCLYYIPWVSMFTLFSKTIFALASVFSNLSFWNNNLIIGGIGGRGSSLSYIREQKSRKVPLS